MGSEDDESSRSIWEQIEHSESYLVCSMYEEAASLVSSVIHKIAAHSGTIKFHYDNELQEMQNAAGMVLLQSLHQLGRTSKILNELQGLFGSVADIPVQVLITGACFQIAEGSSAGVQEPLENFLNKWSLGDGECYFLIGSEANLDLGSKCGRRFVLGVDKYLEVVEIYAVNLLGNVLNNAKLAISWVEKAAIPEDKRQELLGRLHSIYSVKNSSTASLLPSDNHNLCSPLKEAKSSDGSTNFVNPEHLQDRDINTSKTVLRLSKRAEPCFWWFRNVTFKFGSFRFVIPNSKIIVGSLIFLLLYIFQRKQTILKRFAANKALSLKKAMMDFWQLAFSYQVNPLAAVQPHVSSR